MQLTTCHNLSKDLPPTTLASKPQRAHRRQRSRGQRRTITTPIPVAILPTSLTPMRRPRPQSSVDAAVGQRPVVHRQLLPRLQIAGGQDAIATEGSGGGRTVVTAPVAGIIVVHSRRPFPCGGGAVPAGVAHEGVAAVFGVVCMCICIRSHSISPEGDWAVSIYTSKPHKRSHLYINTYARTRTSPVRPRRQTSTRRGARGRGAGRGGRRRG